MKLFEIVTDANYDNKPGWRVSYSIHGSNKDVPLYIKSRIVYADTEEAAIEFCKKYLSHNIISIEPM